MERQYKNKEKDKNGKKEASESNSLPDDNRRNTRTKKLVEKQTANKVTFKPKSILSIHILRAIYEMLTNPLSRPCKNHTGNHIKDPQLISRTDHTHN